MSARAREEVHEMNHRAKATEATSSHGDPGLVPHSVFCLVGHWKHVHVSLRRRLDKILSFST